MAKESVERVLTKTERVEALNQKMEKRFGKGIVMGAQDNAGAYDHISTGSLGLDKALGIGGLPKGRITEIFGWESGGKTTMAIHCMAEAHKKKDSWCAFIDVEHAFTSSYAKSLGVDLDRLKISQPDNAEDALEIAEEFITSGDFDVVVVDSVAALVLKSELERGYGESSMGKQANFMSQAMRKLTPIVGRSSAVVIFINQMREKIGVMFGSPDTTPGGNALKFYATIRLEVFRSITASNSVLEGDEKVGNLVKVKVKKNKLAPPFKECEFDMLYGVGIDKYGELLEMGVTTGVITKSGHSYSYKDISIGKGKQAAIDMLKNCHKNASLVEMEIREDVINTYVPKEFEATKEEVEESKI